MVPTAMAMALNWVAQVKAFRILLQTAQQVITMHGVTMAMAIPATLLSPEAVVQEMDQDCLQESIRKK
jgi:hypothetical protein